MTEAYESQRLLDWSARELRRREQAIDVKTGYCCPEPDAEGYDGICGRRYRHQHGDVWWPPVGQP